MKSVPFKIYIIFLSECQLSCVDPCIILGKMICTAGEEMSLLGMTDSGWVYRDFGNIRIHFQINGVKWLTSLHSKETAA